MAYTEAQKRATEKYKQAKYKRIPLDVTKDYYETIKAAADAAKCSVNGYIKTAIQERLERDKAVQGDSEG